VLAGAGWSVADQGPGFHLEQVTGSEQGGHLNGRARRRPGGIDDSVAGSPYRAVDLICWTKQICFADVVEFARCEIAAFRYRVLHVAARLTRSARQLRLRIDKTWRWAAQIAEGFDRLRAGFA
jgi:hypothetical protein